MLKVFTTKNLVLELILLIRKWIIHFTKSFVDDNGYLIFFSIIGIYITIFTLIDAKASRDFTNLSTDFSTFTSYSTSGDEKGLKIAFSMHSKILKKQIYKEPNIFAPTKWFDEYNPFYEQLHNWTNSYINYRSPNLKLNMTGLILEDAEYYDIDFSNAIFNHSKFHNVTIRDEEFYQEFNNSIESTFENSKLKNIDISYCDLRTTNFNNTDFSPIIKKSIHKIIYDSYFNSQIRNTNLEYCSFENANLMGVDFYNVIAKNIDFRKTKNMRSVSFTESILDKSNFSKKNLMEVADRSLFVNTIHKNGFYNSSLIKAKFIGTNLTNINFHKADLTDADFSKAIIKGTYLKTAIINGTNFNSAIYDENTIFPENFNKEKYNLIYKPNKKILKDNNSLEEEQ